MSGYFVYFKFNNYIPVSLLLQGMVSLSVILFMSGCTTMKPRAVLPDDAPCDAHLRQVHTGESTVIEQRMAHEVDTLQLSTELALVYREVTIRVYRQLEGKIQSGQPLSGADLDTLNQGMVDHLVLREQLLEQAHAHECWPSMGEDAMKRAGISATQQLKGVMVLLAAALVLYDNYLLAIASFDDNPKLRRMLNAKDRGYRLTVNELKKVSISYASPQNRRKMLNAIHFYKQQRELFSDAIDGDNDFSYLDLLISGSPSYNRSNKWSSLNAMSNSVGLVGDATTDTLSQLSKEGVNLFSMVFGNTLGLVQLRKGLLYGQADVSDKLGAQLQPGDILLEKTPFRLTDKFIPGHWGHAAIWVGSEEELRNMGIWEHPLVRPHQREISRGQGVVEALRGGVTMNSMAHFLNVDDVAVLRQRTLDAESRKKIVLQTMRQIGKTYDFNFDVETTDKIVCSELIYVTYTEQTWPTEKVLGRSTISPDNVANRALDDGPFKLVLFYHDGEAVKQQPLQLMQRLMLN